MTIKRLKYKSKNNTNDLLNVVFDVNSYSSFLPYCKESTITKNISNNKFEADLLIGYSIFNYRYTSIVERCNNSIVVIAKDKKQFKNLYNKWDFNQIDDQNTVIDFYIDFDMQNIVLHTIVNKTIDSMAKNMIIAFENRINSTIL